MLAKIKFIFLYWIIWILVFEICRLIFLIYNFQEGYSSSLSDLVQTFLYGLRMDASMASYLSLPVCIFLLLAIFTGVFSKPSVYIVYTAIILLPVLLIIFCDLPAYKAWGNRLDSTPLKYLSSPGEAWASVSHLPLVWIFISFGITYFLIYRSFQRFIQNNKALLKNKNNKLMQLIVLAIFTGLQIIPLRGGFQLAPLNQSSVFFSKDNFANLAAVNVTWNFMHSVSHSTESTTNPFAYLANENAKLVKESLLMPAGITEKMIDISLKPDPNIILIIWESFTEKATHVKKNGHIVTPGFNELKNEGIYFSNIYATGDRTDKGLVAILSGYPSQPTKSIIAIPQKANKLPKLPKLYSARRYHNSFYYGGELEFANMKAYLLGSGFDHFTSKDDFDKKDQNSKWGAHDHVVKNKLLQDLSEKQHPFFTTWLTLSSHEPYETPVSTVIKGKDDESLFLNSVHYTDSVIYNFIQQCRQQAWWNNTLVVIVADHGHLLPRTRKKIDRFKIPMLWLGGALVKKGIEINNTGSQIDLAATLLAQTCITPNPFEWSKDLLKSGTKQWAYFSFNNGFGYVEPDRYLIYDNVGKRDIEKKGDLTENDRKKGMSLQQMSFADYIEK